MTAAANETWFDPDATTFGDRVAGAREQARMTQGQLAKRLGVRKKTIEEWENDHAEPRASHLSMMAGMLNVSLSWLLTGEGEGPDGPEQLDADSHDVAGMLVEMRDLRVQLAQSAARVGRLEKSLRRAFKELHDV